MLTLLSVIWIVSISRSRASGICGIASVVARGRQNVVSSAICGVASVIASIIASVIASVVCWVSSVVARGVTGAGVAVATGVAGLEVLNLHEILRLVRRYHHDSIVYHGIVQLLLLGGHIDLLSSLGGGSVSSACGGQ